MLAVTQKHGKHLYSINIPGEARNAPVLPWTYLAWCLGHVPDNFAVLAHIESYANHPLRLAQHAATQQQVVDVQRLLANLCALSIAIKDVQPDRRRKQQQSSLPQSA